jgi:hypothetical protein
VDIWSEILLVSSECYLCRPRGEANSGLGC